MPGIESIIGLLPLRSDLHFGSPEVAALLDDADELKEFRNEFELPTNTGIGAKRDSDARKSQPCTYFVGNSLGPLPKRSRELLREELDVWASSGVTGHFAHPHDRNWMNIASRATGMLTDILGARDIEIACMGTLTANLHLMMSSFYKPTGARYKILCEYRAFPSDEYAFASQVALHGYDPLDAIIRLAPRPGEYYLRESDILQSISKNGDSIALVLFSGVQYYTGQWFPMQNITKAAHDAGALCGWDLAHAVGNVPLQLHDWNIDFAVWCTYKYLNSGPGGIAGLFIHEKWHEKLSPRLAGWWGHDEATRFQMPDTFQPIPGAQGFQQSNPSALTIASLIGSLEVFSRAGGMGKLRAKSVRITAYLEALFQSSRHYIHPKDAAVTFSSKRGTFTIITPSDSNSRGTQLSLLFSEKDMPTVFDKMIKGGVIGDERHPGIIRYAPCPLYCSFSDCKRTAELLDQVLDSISTGQTN